ncbi:MAG TPA: DUF58 domain-containing protein [Verrucomicrobiae bacterium]
MKWGLDNFRRRSYRQYRGYYVMRRWIVRRVGRVGVLILGCTIVLAMFGLDTNLTVAYQALSLMLVLILVALLTRRLAKTKFSAHRILPRFASAGSPVKYRVRFKNLGRFTVRDVGLLEELSDPRPTLDEFLATPEPGEEKRNWFDRTYGFYRWQWLVDINQRAIVTEGKVDRCLPKAAVEVEMELLPRRRGVLHFEKMIATSMDPLGIFRQLSPVTLPDKLLILPKRYAIPHFALPGTMRYQQGGVALAASVGESEEFVSLRDYRPGDPMRHIHWKSWARSGKPIVKEFQDEFFVRHALILDTFDTVAYSEQFEEAVSVAASFACTIQTQDSLLDLMFVGAQAYCFTAGRGLAHTEQMLEILASVNLCQTKGFKSLANVVVEHIPVVSGCICVLLKWDEPRKEFIQMLRGLNVPVVVFIVTEKNAAKIMDLGPMADIPAQFHQLEVGKVEEALRAL